MKKILMIMVLFSFVLLLNGCDYEVDLETDVNNNSGTIDITLQYNEGMFKQGDKVEIDYVTEEDGWGEDAYWQLSADGEVGDSWNDTTSCWFLCNFYLEFDDVDDGEYYLIVLVEVGDSTEIVKSTGTFVFSSDPLFIVTPRVDEYTGQDNYRVEFNITGYNIGSPGDFYYQISTSPEYDDSEWIHNNHCIRICEYRVIIQDLEEGLYYLHLKMSEDEYTQYYTLENQFEIVLSDLEVCEYTSSEECLFLETASYIDIYENIIVEARTVNDLKVLYIEYETTPAFGVFDYFTRNNYLLFSYLDYDELAEFEFDGVYIAVESEFVDEYGTVSVTSAVQYFNTVDELSKYTWSRVEDEVVLDWITYLHPDFS